MARKKQEKIRKFECWRCERRHDFLAVREASKTLPRYQEYSNKIYHWKSVDDKCPGAMIEGFDPEEVLFKSKSAQRRLREHA